MKQSFSPIANPDAKILILGTMPGEKSLALGQYYGHGGNQFWRIIFDLFKEPITSDYSKKKELLLNNKIALWDVLDNCQREGSSDTSIHSETPNDFNGFFREHQQIKNILFNGGNAATYYNTYIGRSNEFNFYTLTSTSPANTWKSFNEKVKEWSVILELLSTN